MLRRVRRHDLYAGALSSRHVLSAIADLCGAQPALGSGYVLERTERRLRMGQARENPFAALELASA
jgi:hypothetical protein